MIEGVFYFVIVPAAVGGVFLALYVVDDRLLRSSLRPTTAFVSVSVLALLALFALATFAAALGAVLGFFAVPGAAWLLLVCGPLGLLSGILAGLGAMLLIVIRKASYPVQIRDRKGR